jgi:hypothetical protein
MIVGYEECWYYGLLKMKCDIRAEPKYPKIKGQKGKRKRKKRSAF